MSMIDFPKIDSQGFFHDWNGFAMVRFNDPHLPSAGLNKIACPHYIYMYSISCNTVTIGAPTLLLSVHTRGIRSQPPRLTYLHELQEPSTTLNGSPVLLHRLHMH